MANKNSPILKMVSLALIVIGIGLAFWGYQMSGSVGSQLSQAISGAASDGVMIRYIGGAACFIVGLFLFMKR